MHCGHSQVWLDEVAKQQLACMTYKVDILASGMMCASHVRSTSHIEHLSVSFERKTFKRAKRTWYTFSCTKGRSRS